MPRRSRLSRLAEEDLLEIHATGFRNFGILAADRYLTELLDVVGLLAERPGMARLRAELRRPVRVHPHRSHVIAYVEDADGILVVRVLPASLDWENEI